MPQSETYVAINDHEIVGFISMVDNYLAALFVKTELQGKGIGTALLNFIKENRKNIELKVFKKNNKTLRFTKRMDLRPRPKELRKIPKNLNT
ncbi:MAG: GNAT family N-acetyltransferase [Bacteroidota bacterium]|nr:GNAT family N-acetyltransferase [Bacteroidota bacterium]